MFSIASDVLEMKLLLRSSWEGIVGGGPHARLEDLGVSSFLLSVAG
jgi:hypothetical protein